MRASHARLVILVNACRAEWIIEGALRRCSSQPRTSHGRRESAAAVLVRRYLSVSRVTKLDAIWKPSLRGFRNARSGGLVSGSRRRSACALTEGAAQVNRLICSRSPAVMSRPPRFCHVPESTVLAPRGRK